MFPALVSTLLLCLQAAAGASAPAAGPPPPPSSTTAEPAPPAAAQPQPPPPSSTAAEPAPPAEPPPAPPVEAPSLPDEAELAKALAADRQARQASAPPAPAPSAPAAGGGGFPAMLNPETSVIGTFSAGLSRDDEVEPFVTSGDDAPVDRTSVQELEITFAGAVDPYFRMNLFLTIPDLRRVEVEEGYVITTALPLNLQLKAGIFRSSFGRNNEQHLHVQDFARRPWTTEILGHDGLRAPGAQLSVLLPTPFYLSLWSEAFMIAPRQPSAVAGIESFFDLSEAWSLMLGVSAATIKRDFEAEEGAPPDPMPVAPPRSELVGGDLYLKWRPSTEVSPYAWAALTAEYIAARDRESREWTGNGYAQVIVQVAQRWRLGARGDLKGLPAAAAVQEGVVRRGLGASASLAFLPTEFSRVRLSYLHEVDLDAADYDNDTVFLQLEATIGAHGAHAF